jgi:polyisoprenoid-binding protein YceI
LTDRILRSRSRGIRRLALVVPIFAAIWSGPFANSVAAQDATPEPTPGVLATEPANIDCATAAAPTTTYAIDGENSEVRYVAEEELAGKGANTAIGSTKAFIGSVYFDEAGLPLPCSRWDADLRTLTSDESRRDNFLYANTLETATYPLATFVLTSVEGLDQPLGADEVTFTLVGDLTIHGVTRAVAWAATAKLEGDTLTGSANTTFAMADFAIEPPKVGPVVSLDENVKLEADITAKVAE